MSFQNPDDRWTESGRNILTPRNLATLRDYLDQGPVIVEHWYYRAARSPKRIIFDDFEDFDQYMNQEARPGDAFHVWDFAALCRDDNTLTDGKFPDGDGSVPERGAY